MESHPAVLHNDLVPAANSVTAVSLKAVIDNGTPREVRLAITELKASLEERLVLVPDDYDALVLLGELNLRVGLVKQARVLLYQASLQQPPSWDAYQRTSYLLRRAEEQEQKSVLPFAGIAPPLALRRLAATTSRSIGGAFQKFNERTGKKG